MVTQISKSAKVANDRLLLEKIGGQLWEGAYRVHGGTNLTVSHPVGH